MTIPDDPPEARPVERVRVSQHVWRDALVGGRRDRGTAPPLDRTTQHVCLVLALFMDGDGSSAWPGVTMVAAKCGRRRDTVIESLGRAVAAGYLDRRCRVCGTPRCQTGGGARHSYDYAATVPAGNNGPARSTPSGLARSTDSAGGTVSLANANGAPGRTGPPSGPPSRPGATRPDARTHARAALLGVLDQPTATRSTPPQPRRGTASTPPSTPPSPRGGASPRSPARSPTSPGRSPPPTTRSPA